MRDDCLKLTTYFGERDRADGGFLADALIDDLRAPRAADEPRAAGVEGFGAKHHLRTDRLLTLSEDLPMVSVAVDTPRADRGGARRGAGAASSTGLVTLERARMLPRRSSRPSSHEDDEAHRLRRPPGARRRAAGLRGGRRPAAPPRRRRRDRAARRRRHRARRRGGARASSRATPSVPLMVVAVGEATRIAAALPELDALLAAPLLTLERVRGLQARRRGARARRTTAGRRRPALWQKLMVYARAGRHDGGPLDARCCARAGAAGATSLRGIWGYHGDHAPHGDRCWQLRRRVPGAHRDRRRARAHARAGSRSSTS